MVARSKVLGKWNRETMIVTAQVPQRFVMANPIFELVSSVIFSRSYLSRKSAVVGSPIILDIPTFSYG
jgi:hypothetical protein